MSKYAHMYVQRLFSKNQSIPVQCRRLWQSAEVGQKSAVLLFLITTEAAESR
jgi:hypothetical protein